MKLEFPGAVPEIPVSDISEAAAYYENNLGFAVDWGGDELGLAGISKGNCRMFLASSDYPKECGNVGPVLIWLNLQSKDAVNDLYRLWSSSKALQPPRPRAMRLLLVLLPLLFLSPGLVGGQALTTRDSSQIGGQIASYFAPQLRSSRGADSTNAVCVKLVSSVRGAFLHSLDSSLRLATGGVLVALVTSIPLRVVEVVALHRTRDTVFVTVRTSSGGLRAGEWNSGTRAKVPIVRTGSTWSRSDVGIVMVGDGYVHKDKPVLPLPPKC